MRRGHGLSFTLGSQLLRLTESAGLVCRFNWARTLTLRRSTKVVATLTDKQCPQVCAFRGLTNYNSETYNSMMSRCNRTKVDYRGLSPIGSLSSIRLLRWCALQSGYSSVILILPKQYTSKYGLRGLFKWLHCTRYRTQRCQTLFLFHSMLFYNNHNTDDRMRLSVRFPY